MNAYARDRMIRHMFVFGVIIPTVITILVFIGFLICWFKFNLRERLFKSKKVASKKPLSKVPPHMVSNGLHNGIHTYPADDDDGESTHEDDDQPDESRDNQLNLGRSQHLASLTKNCETTVVEAEEGSVTEDIETALCLYKTSVPTGINNPNLHTSPTKTCDNGEVPASDNDDDGDDDDDMVQHTFHFPVSDCSHLNSAAIDSEGSEDGNYGHFVPLSQALKNPKTRQFFAAAKFDTGITQTDCNNTDMRSDSHRPVMVGV